MTLRLEVGDAPRPRQCPDCGALMHTTRGFVYRDGDAYALYFATLPAGGHHAGRADLAIGIAEWGDGAETAEVSAFLQLWTTQDEYQMGFVDPSDSGWSGSHLLGGALTAVDAREHARRKEILEVADLVIAADPAVAAALAAHSGSEADA